MKKLLTFLITLSVATIVQAAVPVGDDYPIEKTVKITFVDTMEKPVYFALRSGTTRAALIKAIKNRLKRHDIDFGQAFSVKTGVVVSLFPNNITGEFLEQNVASNGTIHIQVISQ